MELLRKNWFWFLLLFLIILETTWIVLILLDGSNPSGDAITSGGNVFDTEKIDDPVTDTKTFYGTNITIPKKIIANVPFQLIHNFENKFSYKVKFYIDNNEIKACEDLNKCTTTLKSEGKHKIMICVPQKNYCDTISIFVLKNKDKLVEDEVDTQTEEIISIVEPEKPKAEVKPVLEEEPKEFTKSGKTGYTVNNRCDANETKVTSSPCSIKLKPTREMELKYLKVVSRKAAKVNITLISNGGEPARNLNNRQLLAGQVSEINFQSLDFVMKKDVTYTITITAASNEVFELEDFKACNGANFGNNDLEVSQTGGGSVFFDIAYKY